MKVHQLTRVELWEQEPSLSLGCKRLRPLAPRLGNTTLHLKTFVNPHPSPPPSTTPTTTPTQSEVQSGGTRWNPTQEQIGILEMLYQGGMRTPNAQQIEHITTQLGNFGKIEGKNVFYWFQNHKARERQRQRQKRSSLSPSSSSDIAAREEEMRVTKEETSYYKRKWRSWGNNIQRFEEGGRLWSGESGGEEGDKTLELFPLHPEGR